MEKMLLKLARQLDSLDEASLMSLWSKYATITSHFEPSKRWEEACLIFSLIQAKHWKNQLFNYCWSKQKTPPLKSSGEDLQGNTPVDLDFGVQKPEPVIDEKEETQCRILQFKPLKQNKYEEENSK